MELPVLGKTNIVRKKNQDYANTVAASNLLSTLFFTVMHTGLREKLCKITYKLHVMTMFFSLFLPNLDFTMCLLLGDHANNFNEYFLNFIAEAWIIRACF